MKSNETVYEQDFYAWTQEQAALLREGVWKELDTTNLAEEIESLGARDRRSMESRCEVLLMHLLKWQYQPRRRQTGHSWYSTIIEQRSRLARLLRDSPSLRRLVQAALTDVYPTARLLASRQTRLPLDMFPEGCPWTAEQVLGAEFWPEGEEK